MLPSQSGSDIVLGYWNLSLLIFLGPADRFEKASVQRSARTVP